MPIFNRSRRGFDISTGLQDVLKRNGLEAHIIQDFDGKLYLAAEGRNYPYNRYEISPAQAQALSQWGYNSTNTKAYNTIKSILKDADMPQALVIVRQAGGMVNMGQWGQRMTPERAGYFPRQRFGSLYNPHYMSRPVPTFPGERLAPGFMRSFDYRSPGLRPTTGVYWKGPQREYQSEEEMPDRLKVSVAPEKPVAAERPEPGKAHPYSEVITAPVYFSKDKYLDILASHGIVVDEAAKTVTIKSSANKLDYRYQLSDAEMAKLLNGSIEPPRGVSLQDRMDVLNNNPHIKRDFAGSFTQEMLESKDIVSIELKPEIKAQTEWQFIEYERYQRQQQRLEEAKTAARREYMAEEGRIRRDPNAISGREIGAIIAGHGFYNGNAHGREAVVAEIRVDSPQDRYAINVNTDKGLLSFNVSKALYENYVNNPEARENIINNLTEEYRENIDPMQGMDIQVDETLAKSLDLKQETVIIPVMIDGKQYDIPFSQQVISEHLANADSLSPEEKIDQIENMVRQELGIIATAPENVRAEVKSWFEENGISNYEALVQQLPKHQKGDILIDGEKATILKAEPLEVKGKDYTMSAVINGQVVTHTISAKDYEKFLRYDDEHRLKLFDSIFGEVSIEPHGRNHVSQGRPDDVFLTNDGRGFVTREELDIQRARSSEVDGQSLRDLNYKKGFYREGAHGREVDVSDIKVEPDPQKEGHYKMTAVINGQAITHDITEKQYNKFLAVDDYQRLKLFSKVFNEVDMKIRPEHRPNVGAMLMAGLVGITQAAHVMADIGRGMPPPPMEPRYNPAIYETRTEHPTRQISASELAAATYEAENPIEGQQVSQGKGMGV